MELFYEVRLHCCDKLVVDKLCPSDHPRYINWLLNEIELPKMAFHLLYWVGPVFMYVTSFICIN